MSKCYSVLNYATYKAKGLKIVDRGATGMLTFPMESKPSLLSWASALPWHRKDILRSLGNCACVPVSLQEPTMTFGFEEHFQPLLTDDRGFQQQLDKFGESR